MPEKAPPFLQKGELWLSFFAAIFDVDGTLLDSMHLWDHVGEEYLKRKGRTAKPDMQERVRTMSMSQIAKYCREEYGIEDAPEQIIDEINGMVEEKYRTQVLAKDGVRELLQWMHQRGIKMAVATASDRCLIEPALEKNGLLSYFDQFLTCSEVGAGKDSPKIFLEGCRRLGAIPSETVVFEDSLYAMKTAAKAGFQIAAVYDDSALDEQEEIRKVADWYFPKGRKIWADFDQLSQRK